MVMAMECGRRRRNRWRWSRAGRSNEWLTPVTGKPGTYRASGVVRTIAAQTPIDVEFSPFYAMHRRSYTAYWDLLSAADLTARAAELAAERERMRALEAATIAHADPGDREGEKKFNQQGVETSVIRTDGRSGRRAIQWFSYDLPLSGKAARIGARRDLQRRSTPAAKL